jgi:DNA polymerase-3 subunit epsilon
MRVLGIDFESTGLDTSAEAITEIGAVLWDTDEKKPLLSTQLICYDEYVEGRINPEVEEMMARVSGIKQSFLREFGKPTVSQFAHLHDLYAHCQVDFIVAHNGENYDRPLALSTLKRVGFNTHILSSLPWLDTRQDIPFPTEPDSRKLKHLALDCGFINPFPHRAVFDVLTMLKVLSHYPIESVIAYSKIPYVTVRGMVSYDERQLAKDQRYSWEKIGEKTYPKCWVKKIKQDQLQTEQERCKFRVVQVE